MGVVVYDGFDAATPTAFPPGWVAGAGLETQSAHYLSPPNAVVLGSNAFVSAYYDADDGNGGDAQVSVVAVPGLSGVGGSNVRDLWLYVRMTTASTTFTSMRAYWMYVDTIFGNLLLGRIAAGASTTFSSATLSELVGMASSTRVSLSAVGTALAGRVQRLSDGKWLNGSNAWQSAPVNAIAATGSGVTGAGRAGFGLERSSSGNLLYVDNFRFETAPVSARRRAPWASYIGA